MNDAAARPGQQGRDHETDALARTRRREAQPMLGAVMAKIGAAEAAEDDAIDSEHAGAPNFPLVRPAPRTISLGAATFAGTPQRHGDGDGDRAAPARGREGGPRQENGRA